MCLPKLCLMLGKSHSSFVRPASRKSWITRAWPRWGGLKAEPKRVMFMDNRISSNNGVGLIISAGGEQKTKPPRMGRRLGLINIDRG